MPTTSKNAHGIPYMTLFHTFEGWRWERLGEAFTMKKGGPFSSGKEAHDNGYAAWKLDNPELTDQDVQLVTEIVYGVPDAHALRDAFLDGLKVEIGLGGLTKVALLNDGEPDESICHSHDFIDANVVMADGFVNVYGFEPDLRSTSQTQLWNSAWSMANKAMSSYVERERRALAETSRGG